MSAPEPIATGTLAKTPLPHLLVYLEQKRLSGTLALWPDASPDEPEPKRQDRILLLKGCPVAGALIEPTASLREGLLRLFARVSAPYAFYATNLLGDDRVSGRVDPLSLIAESLRGSTRDDVVQEVLQRFGRAPLALQAGIDVERYELQPSERALVERLRSEPSDLPSLIAKRMLPETYTRRVIYLLAITKAVASVEKSEAAATATATAPRPAEPAAAATPGASAARPPAPPNPGAPAGSMGGTAPAVPGGASMDGTAPALRGGASSDGTAPALRGGASMDGTAPALRGGASMRPRAANAAPSLSPAAAAPAPIEIDMSAGSMQDSLHGSLDRLQSIPPPPDSVNDELRQRWLRVVAKGRLIENQNYFEMLDLDKETKSAEARSKFYQLAKEWHPDRLPAEMESLREYVQIIFSYMSEASAQLGDENLRMKYVQTVREGGGTPATDRLMQAILDTAMEYERVLVLSRKHQYDDAIDVMKRILSVMKDDAEYHAMYAWLLMQKFPGQGQEAPLQKMLESVDKALALHERHEKANLLKAQISRRMGRQDDAFDYFRRVAEINPRNIDAMREVRVATMRAGGAAPPKPKPKAKPKGKPGKGKRPDSGGMGGLFGKLFKKDP